MVVTEKKVITLANGSKYYILDDLGNPGDEPEIKYLFAIGITPDWDFDSEDIIFIKNYQENGNQMVVKVSENDPMYEQISNIEAIKVRLETDPKFRNELEKNLSELEESSE